MTQKRESLHGLWSSRIAFLFAASGAAVGLGNIWKFPYITGRNGGGAFVLIYLLCVLLLGIPLLVAEILAGRRGRRNPASALEYLAKESKLSPLWKYLGYLFILASFLILSYYSVIAGWACDYVVKAFTNSFIAASSSGIDSMFENFIANPVRVLFWHSVVMAATVLIVALGVQKGLERANYIMFPVMLFILLLLVGYGIDIGYFSHGVEFLFKPDFSKLTPSGVLVALGHAFFTLSLACGSIMVYGAYVPKKFSIFQAGIFIAIMDTLMALIAGTAIFPLVFANGLEPAVGPSLIFKTLPLAFGHMPYGVFFGTLFFVMLVFAAFTSAISLLEPSVAWAIETFRWSRAKASVVVGSLIWLLGITTVLSFSVWKDFKLLYNMNVFEALDHLTANIMLPCGGLLMTIFMAWRMKKSAIVDELGKAGTLFNIWYFILRYITPLAIIFVILNLVGIVSFSQ